MNKSLYEAVWLNDRGLANRVNVVAESGEGAIAKSKNTLPSEFKRLFEVKHLGWIHCE